MAWVNWSGYVPEIPGAWAFGRTPYRTYEDAMAAWTGKGNDPAAAEIKWYPYPAWGETEADRPGAKPPGDSTEETPVENYRGYIIGKTAAGQYHLWTGENYPDVPWGTGLGFYNSIAGAEKGADADIASKTGGGTQGGKEIVFEFSKAIVQNDAIVGLIRKTVSLLGGKNVYIEGDTKLVVVM